MCVFTVELKLKVYPFRRDKIRSPKRVFYVTQCSILVSYSSITAALLASQDRSFREHLRMDMHSLFTILNLLSPYMVSSRPAVLKALPTAESAFPKLTVMSLLLVPCPIFKTHRVERRRIMEPFTNLLQTTHVNFEIGAKCCSN